MTDTGPSDVVDPSVPPAPAQPDQPDNSDLQTQLADLTERLSNVEATVANLVEGQIEDEQFDDGDDPDDDTDENAAGFGAQPTTSDSLDNDLGPGSGGGPAGMIDNGDDDDDEIDLMVI